MGSSSSRAHRWVIGASALSLASVPVGAKRHVLDYGNVQRSCGAALCAFGALVLQWSAWARPRGPRRLT